MTTLAVPPAQETAPPRFHWTVDVFYRAVSAGVFDEPKRWELVSGDLWEKEPANPPHATVTARIARRLRTVFEPRMLVREEKPLHLAADGKPLPDVCVVPGTDDDYEEHHSTNRDAVLVVEVSDTTGAWDTGEKALRYAQAGIPDYWVSLVNERVLVVFRDPTPDGYPEPLRLTEAGTVRSLAAPDVEIPVRDLIARAVLPSA